MAFKHLKALVEEKYKVYLILLIWLIIGYTVFQFVSEAIIGTYVLLPLTMACFLYFIFMVLFKDKVHQKPLTFLLVCILFSYPLGLILLNYMFIILGVLLLIGSYIWIIITAIFAMDSCYRKSVEWDEKIKNLQKPFNYIIRGVLFIGGIFLATELLLLASTFLLNMNNSSPGYQLNITYLYLQTWLMIWILFIIGIISLFFKKFNLWLGVFVIFITGYAIFLMITTYQLYYGSTTRLLPISILQYLFSIYLLLNSAALLFDERAETIAKKLKIGKSEIILMLLIFSMASFQLVAGLIGATLAKFELNIIAFMFPYLALIFGIYAIFKQSRKKKSVLKEEPDKLEMDKFVPSTQSNTIYCSNCGVANTSDNKFCINCGKELYK
ncbi:MAG: zinc ribbon domain-containing protein [Promethearchaeota archaeon]|nr:MAG: zinc ribbon domain-containing protein [Candidatus Lokiarchaeota archaeon]